MRQNLQQIKEAFLMAKHMLIFVAHSWSLSNAYKKVYVMFVIKTFDVEKTLIEKREFFGETILYVIFFSKTNSISKSRKLNYAKWSKIYLY